jgi:hypothetical protein
VSRKAKQRLAFAGEVGHQSRVARHRRLAGHQPVRVGVQAGAAGGELLGGEGTE